MTCGSPGCHQPISPQSPSTEGSMPLPIMLRAGGTETAQDIGSRKTQHQNHHQTGLPGLAWREPWVAGLRVTWHPFVLWPTWKSTSAGENIIRERRENPKKRKRLGRPWKWSFSRRAMEAERRITLYAENHTETIHNQNFRKSPGVVRLVPVQASISQHRIHKRKASQIRRQPERNHS